jgi:hypothetical protein
MSVFRKTVLSDRAERAVQKTLANVHAQRRKRFRVLACIDETEESFDTVRLAARLANTDDCDIIVLFVRSIDQGLWSGGLQVRVARQNMLDSGLELPGLNRLRQALDVLRDEGIPAEDWPRKIGSPGFMGRPARRQQGGVQLRRRPLRGAQAEDCTRPGIRHSRPVRAWPLQPDHHG